MSPKEIEELKALLKENAATQVTLYEQIQLVRKSVVLIHEQLARIESKLDDQVSKINARILLK